MTCSLIFIIILNCLCQNSEQIEKNINTVKPAHMVTFIQQSPVLKGHIFLEVS